MTTLLNSPKTISETITTSWTFDSFKIINIEVGESSVIINIGLFDSSNNNFNIFPIKTIQKELFPDQYANMTPSDLNLYIAAYIQSL